ncbi:NAD(P)/FAD-dependent oxidoreductase [Kineococcus sp. SYSU DK001]|uniref:NAD(P)/FAD-dependent oxidoreductase n=1 Tax=Kineococcus sp. SYSU DK001 TaxID=3383122 RepID=UPI003D7CBFA2
MTTTRPGPHAVSSTPFWLDSPLRPQPRPALARSTSTDLLVVGGGYQGLWTALKAKERRPDRDVVLLEAGRVGGAASGRNGGFVSSSLTHGIGGAHSRWPGHTADLERLGLNNLAGLRADLDRHGIECEFEMTGKLAVATDEHQMRLLEATRELQVRYGHDVTVLSGDDVAKRLASPRFVGGTFAPGLNALVNPAKLAWGLLAACESAGVRVFESSPVLGLREVRDGVRATTATAAVKAAGVVLATNGFRPLLRRLRLTTVPVYDYALVTEPLTPAQLESIGWSGREGVTDSGNQFHYTRLTADDRVLWGGYDAVYHYGSRISDDLDQRPRTFGVLAEHFAQTFPTLREVRFTHAWGGLIDTSTRFFATYGRAAHGRIAYALGHTGLGVASTRFAAEACLDLLDGLDTERTRSPLVRSTALPFPPEPVRWAGVQVTRWSLAREDATGRRNPWLRALDRFGVGFDS